MRKKLFTFLLALVTSVGLSYAAVDGKLPGAFTINSNGDQIVFSKGNLQYHCTNHVWQFATNQYDIIGDDNANISDSYDGWIDLFGYGTGNNPTLASTSYDDYSTFTDWGVNAISNGGNEANQWRTLTTQELVYMFILRPEAHNKYGAATVANVPGIIVLPDVYVGSPINTVRDAWNNNVISSSDWAAYEAAGAVFLPAAGYRSGTTMKNDGSYSGFCWSSTPDPGDAKYSYKLCLSPTSVQPQGFGLRYEGIFVRLVQAASAPTPAPTSSVTAARFVYNYDCQRNPPYPQAGSPCNLSGFQDPYEGYKGTRNGNIALGPWKLEFVAYYTPSNNYDCASQVNDAVHEYYTNLSYEEMEAKKLEVPIFRLWQYNLTAREFQPATYGIVCAYAGEANAQDHGALFVSSNDYGCFLTGHQHTSSFQISCENDLTTGMTDLVAAASAPSDPYYDVVWPVIVSIDAIGTVELSEHCKYYIEGSRAAYNALTDEQKAQVTNYSTLTNAETQWEALAAAAQPYADAVIALINAIPNPVVYTQECKDAIDAAQAAYDALTDGQKMFVSNYETLKNAPSDLINAAPYVHILFEANGNEKKVENVTLPRAFTEAEMTTTLKELYGVEGDYDMYAYDNSNADAVNISYEGWTISPFMGKVNVNGALEKYDPQTGFDQIDFSLEISLELPPFGPAPASADEQVSTNEDPKNPSYHYSTFFHSTQNYKLTNDGTEAFIADLSGSDLVLTKIAEGTQVIPANTAVILRKSGSADPVVLIPTAENGVSVNPDENSLEGVDNATLVTDITGLTTTNCYVLSGTTEHGVGFYRINGNTLKAHKAYVKYAGSPSNAPKKMRFVFDQATGVEAVTGYGLQVTGQKLIENGQLIIIKNGVRYNAQGQVIK